MLRSRSFDLTNRIIEVENPKVSALRGSVGADLQDLAKDRAIVTDPEETRRRRTIRLTRQHLRVSWGFTLQTYGIRNKKSKEVEVMSYVDYVEMNGPAFRAGMKKGDVILSVNGESVDTCTHRDLVTKIQRGGRDLRLVVLFEDCCRKVELQERYIRLKKLLNLKLKELRRLEGEESRLLRGGAQPYSQTNGENLCSTPTLLSRLSALRQSVLSSSSTYSSASSDWDVYSEITSPASMEDVRVNKFAYDSSLSDVSYVSSTQGSNGSVSISLSSASDSQSELKADTASDARHEHTSNEFKGKGILKGSRLPSNGQEEESELDISISNGQDDGDTDSQTSFSLSECSPRMSNLSEIMAREESNRHDEDDENFRHMYTVARWVGMNTGLERRRSLSGPIDIPLFGDLGGTGRPRTLGSVNETNEEGASNGQETPDTATEKACEETSNNTATPTAKGSRLQVSSPQNFYSSDSEESSVMSGHTGRDRRDTVIDVRDYEASNGYSQSISAARSNTSTPMKEPSAISPISNTNTPVKEPSAKSPISNTNTPIKEPSAKSPISNTSTLVKEPSAKSSNTDISSNKTVEIPDSKTKSVDLKPSSEPIPEVCEVSNSSDTSPFHNNSQLVRERENCKDSDQNTVSDHPLPDTSRIPPRLIQGVLVNDQTYSTKL